MFLSRHSRSALHDVSAAAASSARSAAAAAAAPASDPVQKARQRMGYKNNWHRDNVETRQVTFSQPLANQPVGIIGGGISGLACAQVCRLSSSKSACITTVYAALSRCLSPLLHQSATQSATHKVIEKAINLWDCSTLLPGAALYSHVLPPLLLSGSCRA
jgi:hypothetical protein